MSDPQLLEASKRIGNLLRQKGKTLATAESCTGGNVAAIITAVPGSSDYFKGGIVAYSDEIKVELLNVNEHTLETCGAVSEETVIEMAKGAMKSLKTDFAIATSGIAGPGGGSKEKPVGTIWMAVGCNEHIMTYKQEKDNGRECNMTRATANVIKMLYEMLITL